MPVIDHIDGAARRIYLHADTVGVDLHPMDVYQEMRALRQNDESLRKFDVFLKAYGHVEKGGGKFTERYVVEVGGTRIVPFDTDQVLNVVGTIITDDGQEGVGCFDRSLLTQTTQVDINYVPPQVEIIEVATGAGATPTEISSAVWSEPRSNHVDPATMGGYVAKKLLTYFKFLAGK